ncbi:MAG TPA: NUDIX domain-containing protein [Nocardioidaceae bacterium]|nr:NUDIX domain-containing protein [Nocardioidaceae bacterium]
MGREPSVVVGAAVVRHGRVLATRRAYPASARGRWELPGGKVEPGETPAAALVREVREELGCTVRATGRLAGEHPVSETLALRVLLAELVAGEPTPHEHDALRWLGPEELDDVDWLEPDRPFLAELRDILLDGHRLEGGNVGGAVRIGRTVRRAIGPWTPAVHRLLSHLRLSGLRAVPAVHGMDARGREMLGYLTGERVEMGGDVLSDAQLADVARWARELHTVVAGFADAGPWRLPAVDGATLIAHNDLAAYNVCFVGDRLTGVFDWDLAGPSTPVLELAHLAWTGVPLFRPVAAADVVRRLRVIATSYAGPTAREVLAAVPVRTQLAVDNIRAAIANGDEQMANLTAIGEPESMEAALAALRLRLPDLDRALAEAPAESRPAGKRS